MVSHSRTPFDRNLWQLSLETQAFVQLTHQNQTQIGGDPRTLKIDLQGGAEGELKRLFLGSHPRDVYVRKGNMTLKPASILTSEVSRKLPLRFQNGNPGSNNPSLAARYPESRDFGNPNCTTTRLHSPLDMRLELRDIWESGGVSGPKGAKPLWALLLCRAPELCCVDTHQGGVFLRGVS